MTAYGTVLKGMALAAAAGLALGAGMASAETIKMKLHTFGSPKQPETKWIFEPLKNCLLYTSPSPRDGLLSRMPSSA